MLEKNPTHLLFLGMQLKFVGFIWFLWRGTGGRGWAPSPLCKHLSTQHPGHILISTILVINLHRSLLVASSQPHDLSKSAVLYQPHVNPSKGSTGIIFLFRPLVKAPRNFVIMFQACLHSLSSLPQFLQKLSNGNSKAEKLPWAPPGRGNRLFLSPDLPNLSGTSLPLPLLSSQPLQGRVQKRHVEEPAFFHSLYPGKLF